MCPEVLSKEVLGIYFGVAYWGGNIQNRVQSDNFTSEEATVTATRFSPFEMGIGDTTQAFYFIEYKHNIPIIPRIIYRNVPITEEGKTTLARGINFVDTSIVTGALVNSTFDLSFTDVSLYYTVIDSWLTLDIGLTQRTIDGSIELISPVVAEAEGEGETGEETGETEGEEAAVTTPTTVTSTANIDVRPVLAYSRISFPIMRSNWRYTYAVQYMNSESEYYSDTENTLSYEMESQSIDYRFDVGYKKVKLMSEDIGDLQSTLEVAGPFIRISVGL